MPELDTDAPSLAGVGSRLHASWIAAWLLSPHDLRPGATMPAMLDRFGDERGARAADIAAYLATLTTRDESNPPLPATDAASIKTGGDLFARLGCIGCHALPSHAATSPTLWSPARVNPPPTISESP